MPDLTDALLPRITENRLPELELGSEFVLPDYAGGSILNLPASVCRLFGVPRLGATPLRAEILAPLGEGCRRVVVVLMDALSLQRLKRWMAGGLAPTWGRLAEAGLLAPITSIVPSTTSAALTSLWTGRSTAAHGIVGYEMWMKEYGVVANTILHAPMSFQGDAGSLGRAGFSPESFLALPTLGEHLAAHGVHAYAFQHHSIAHSGLSKMFVRGVRARAFSTPAELWINVRQQMEAHPQERQFLWVYWGEVDHFSHLYGPEDERTVEEFAGFTAAFERLFLERLSPAARQGTALILIADHGQIPTRPDAEYDLRHHPDLLRRLHLLPTGENRLAYLFLKPGQRQAVREYVERAWPGRFVFLNPGSAVRAGLFGTGKHHPQLMERLGDAALLARGEAFLWWSNKDDHLYGRHGGLSAEEMIVPFLGVRL